MQVQRHRPQQARSSPPSTPLSHPQFIMIRNLKRLAALSLLILGSSAAAAASTTVGEWNYNLVPNGIASNNYANLNPAYRKAKAQLFQDGGAYTFRIQGTGVDECFTRELTSNVEKTLDVTIITPTPQMRTCPRVRFIIKNDGSGGQVMVNVGRRNVEQWAEEESDYGLTQR